MSVETEETAGRFHQALSWMRGLWKWTARKIGTLILVAVPATLMVLFHLYVSTPAAGLYRSTNWSPLLWGVGIIIAIGILLWIVVRRKSEEKKEAKKDAAKEKKRQPYFLGILPPIITVLIAIFGAGWCVWTVYTDGELSPNKLIVLAALGSLVVVPLLKEGAEILFTPEGKANTYQSIIHFVMLIVGFVVIGLFLKTHLYFEFQ
jgi:hypothetical protein